MVPLYTGCVKTSRSLLMQLALNFFFLIGFLLSVLSNKLEQILVDGPLPISMSVIVFVRVSTALIGAVFNATLIYITYKQKNLHGICNILIGFNAFSNLLFQIGYGVWPVLLMSGIRVIKLSLCFCFQILPTIGSTTNNASLLLIALDRLLCIASPIRYATINKHMYLSILVLFITIYCSLNGILTYQFMMINPDKKVSCTITDCASPTINNFVLFINFTCCLCYAVIWTILKTSLLGSQTGDKATQRIFKSLVIILMVSVMPWAFTILLKTFLNYMKVSSLNVWYAGSIIGYGIIIGSFADILILYNFSTEYKTAIKHQLIKNDTSSTSSETQVKKTVKSFSSKS